MASAARFLKLYFYYLWRGRYRDAHHLARIIESGYFDRDWYLERNHDVADAGSDPAIHYLDFGAAEMRNPSELFDTRYYVANNSDALPDGFNPLLHFLGQHRPLRPATWRRPELRPQKPVVSKPVKKPKPVSRYSADARGRSSLPRYVVYTAVVGGYDDLKPLNYVPPNCDFVVFSDHPLQAPGWKVLPLNYLNRDPARASRFVKLHPHVYFPEYTHSIWMDANIGVLGDIGAFFDSLGNDASIAAFRHPLRECIYDEGTECIARRKDDENVINLHLQRYREAHVPEKIGLWETNFLVRRHHDPACIELMSRWWQAIQTGSRRDQLSLPVVQRDLDATIAPLDTLGVCARRHPLLTLSPHRRRRALPQRDAVWPSYPLSDGMRQPPVTVGICVHNALDALMPCLASVAAARQPEDTIIIVDDASDQPTASFLDQFVAAHHRVKLIRNSENLGYTKSANQVFKAASTDWVILLNSDTVVPGRAFRKLVEAGEQFPRLAIVGPVSNAASWQTVPRLTGEDGAFLVNRLRRRMTPEIMDGLCEETALAAVMFVPLVNGFCIAVRRKALDEIGYFDEQRFPLGYGEEDDLCLRAAEAGYVCGVTTNTYVFHGKSASFTSERRRLLSAEGQSALTAKYGAARMKALTEYMRSHPGFRSLRVRLRPLERTRARLLSGGLAHPEPAVGQPSSPTEALPPGSPSELGGGQAGSPETPMV